MSSDSITAQLADIARDGELEFWSAQTMFLAREMRRAPLGDRMREMVVSAFYRQANRQIERIGNRELSDAMASPLGRRLWRALGA